MKLQKYLHPNIKITNIIKFSSKRRLLSLDDLFDHFFRQSSVTYGVITFNSFWKNTLLNIKSHQSAEKMLQVVLLKSFNTRYETVGLPEL